MTAVAYGAEMGARAAEALVWGLTAGERTDVVLSPGSRSAPLALAFSARPEVALHVVLDERAAAFVALGLSRATGRAAVLVCTSGSAPAHYLPAIVEARHCRVPLIVVTADRPRELHGVGAHQAIEQTQLFGEQVVHKAELPVPDPRVPREVFVAIAAGARARSVGSPPGPVHLNAPFREPLWQVPSARESDALPSPSHPHTANPCNAVLDPRAAPFRIWRGTRTLPPAGLDQLATELSVRQRGVIVCGPLPPTGAEPDAAVRAVADLARALDWPILAEPTSGLRHGLHDRGTLVCNYDALLRHEPFSQAAAPDCVLRIGRVPVSKALGQWLATHGAGRVLLLDPDSEMHDPSGAAEGLVVSDVADTCSQLARMLDARPRERSWLDRWRRADERALAALEPLLGGALWQGALARALTMALPDGAQLHVGSGMPIRDVDGFGGSSPKSLRVHSNRGVNGIDGLVATAAGVALASPRRPTVALIGDLSLLHDLDGLASTAELGAPLTIVVANNGGGGIFEFLPIREAPEFSRLFLTPQRASLERIATGFGIHHRHVSSSDEVAPTIEAALSMSVPVVVEVAIDRALDVARHQSAWQSVAQALDGGEF